MSEMPLFDRVRPPAGPRVFRVSEINRAARLRIEQQFGDVRIEGELSDVKRSPAGHIYFALNDESDQAQLRGVMFRGDARRTRAPLRNGTRVEVRGQLSLYEPRGSFQLIARSAKAAGEGALAAQFEATRKRLAAEGLIDPERRRALPAHPRIVGVATSRAGAAMHDIIRVAHARFPVRIVVADCRVQGEDAPRSITNALRQLAAFGVDIAIVGRGGGAAEDLWAFNDERVARAIAAFPVPIVSAVGHETDVTIADLVADARASTPTHAAELVVPEHRALAQKLDGLERRLERAAEVRLGRARLALERAARHLSDPRHLLHGRRRALDEATRELEGAISRAVSPRRRALADLDARLGKHDPRATLARDRAALVALEGRLSVAMRTTLGTRRRALVDAGQRVAPSARARLAEARGALRTSMASLDAMSPLKVLERGYAIALREDGRALRHVADASGGERLALRLADGTLGVTVTSTTAATDQAKEDHR